MTDDEIKLIYEHLHEYFDYEDGDLIAIKTSQGKVPIGSKIGSFASKRNAGVPIIMCSLTVNKKRYSLQLKHLIYLYHHKVWPRNILLIDGNAMNCAIENLKAVDTLNPFILQKENYANKSGATPYHHNGKTRYRVRLSTDNGRFTIGSYDNEKTAKECYTFAKTLAITHAVSNEEIQRLALEKFPSNQHKKVFLKGVSIAKNRRTNAIRFKALYCKDGIRKHIGTYDTEIEAHEAYLDYVEGLTIKRAKDAE